MLFLGTKKYPEENSYNTFLNQNGGYSNAFTASEETNYFFEVQHEKLEVLQLLARSLAAGSLFGQGQPASHHQRTDSRFLACNRRRLTALLSSSSLPCSRTRPRLVSCRYKSALVHTAVQLVDSSLTLPSAASLHDFWSRLSTLRTTRTYKMTCGASCSWLAPAPARRTPTTSLALAT